ncbi:MAG: PH domain-containing protein [Geminicoccaceae bacterium]
MRALEPKMIFEGEHIVYTTGYHWVYVFRSFFPLLLVFILGSIVWSLMPSRLTSSIIVISLIASIAWVVLKVFESIIKKAYVTNRRLIYRVGWTYRDTIDVTLDRIGGIKMDQDVWQRFFGYGTVQVIVPVVVIILPRFLRNPIGFRNALYIQATAAPEKPDDDEAMMEEEARAAREREELEDQEGRELETVPLSEYEALTSDTDLGSNLGGELGADLGSEVGSADEVAADVAVDVDTGSDDT